MPTGRVKWFEELKGYGFIIPDARGKDVFVHRSGIAGGLKRLPENARVEYQLEEGRRGPTCYESPGCFSVLQRRAYSAGVW
jgi:CspA family cold shock protein